MDQGRSDPFHGVLQRPHSARQPARFGKVVNDNTQIFQLWHQSLAIGQQRQM